MEFFIPMKKIPTVTHQQKQVAVINGKPRFYEPDALVLARQQFMTLFSKHVPPDPFTGPISLITKWCYPTKAKKYKDGDWKITKPDTDNLIKLPKDCMTALKFWTDDAIIASETIQKFWVTDSPGGIYVRIEVLS